MTKISNIIRGVTTELGRGGIYFNDKLKNGTRSIKVLGFGAGDYDILEERLMNAGFGVKRIETTGTMWQGRVVTRPLTRLYVRVPE